MGILEVTGLRKSFGGLLALNELSFSVREGEILGMIGPNGAGKTTTFNIVTGYDAVDRGSITFAGVDITGWRPDQVAKHGLVRTFQVVEPFRSLTTMDNIVVGALCHSSNLSAARRTAETVIARVGLERHAHDPASDLTIPDLRRLELARAVATQPKTILLDEAMAGLTPAEQQESVALVKDLNKKEGITFIVVEHVMRVITSLVNRLIVLHHGLKIAEGSADQVLRTPTVIEAYLGQETASAGG